MPKVTIIGGSTIYVGSEVVGRLDGRGEVYVLLKNKEGVDTVVARFKYRSPKAGAVHWVKFILSKMAAAEVVEALKDRSNTPIGLAEKFGYVSYNVLQLQKEKAKRDAHDARFKNVTIINKI